MPHRHRHATPRRSPYPAEHVQQMLLDRGWQQGNALSAAGFRGRLWTKEGQLPILVVENTGTGHVRVFRETRHEVGRVVTGKLPPA